MQYLELKIPPVAQVIIAGLLMWLLAQITPSVSIVPWLSVCLFVLSLCLGLGIGILGVLTFKKAKTTVNPTQPGSASSLVNQGVYRITRNPMYVGLTICLIGFAIFLANVFSLIIILLFTMYMTHFQIKPEERVLSQIFGLEYSNYQRQVRRWL